MVNEKLIEEKYLEMKEQGITEDFLNFEAFGELKLFINHKPKMSMLSLQLENDMLYVGSDS